MQTENDKTFIESAASHEGINEQDTSRQSSSSECNLGEKEGAVREYESADDCRRENQSSQNVAVSLGSLNPLAQLKDLGFLAKSPVFFRNNYDTQNEETNQNKSYGYVVKDDQLTKPTPAVCALAESQEAVVQSLQSGYNIQLVNNLF